jgi:hypothetical protein
MASVEERLAKVEKDLAELMARSNSPAQKPGWIKKVEGSFKGDPDFLEIARLGKEARNAEKDQE